MKLSLTPRQWLGGVFLALVALYTLFQARFLILGPQVKIDYPPDGFVATSSLMTISGTARNVTAISLDGRPIFLDQYGNFSEELLVPPDESTILIQARDRFGRETEKTARIALRQ
jgi:hypothetical protein